MANIKVRSKCPVYDGMEITFRTPCDGTEVSGLIVYYPEASENSLTEATQTFEFKDAHGKALTGMEDLFVEGVYIKAILDTGNGYAYLQNADNNSFLNALRQYAGKVDAKMEYGSYDGTNASLATIPFDRTPTAIIISGGGKRTYYVPGSGHYSYALVGCMAIITPNGGVALNIDQTDGTYVDLALLDVREFGQNVTWTAKNGLVVTPGAYANDSVEPGESIMNTQGVTYQYIAFFEEE